jgi:hypothetical protein
MIDPDLIERIRTIFLQERPFVSIAKATVLLGWSRGEMKRAIAGGEIELVPTAGGRAVARRELMAKALELWPMEGIEEALGASTARVLPEALWTRAIAPRIPRYKAAMLDYLAEREQTTIGEIVSRALDDLAGEHFDALAVVIPGFAEAVAWPEVEEMQLPS